MRRLTLRVGLMIALTCTAAASASTAIGEVGKLMAQTPTPNFDLSVRRSENFTGAKYNPGDSEVNLGEFVIESPVINTMSGIDIVYEFTYQSVVPETPFLVGPVLLDLDGTKHRCAGPGGDLINVFSCLVNELDFAFQPNTPAVFGIYFDIAQSVPQDISFTLVIDDAGGGDARDGITIAGMDPFRQLTFPPEDIPLQKITINSGVAPPSSVTPTPTPTATVPPVAVGGLVVGPLAAAQPSGGSAGRLAGTIAAIAALAVALTGAAWYARRRLHSPTAP